MHVHFFLIADDTSSKRTKPPKGAINLGQGQGQSQQPTTLPFFPETQDPSCDVYGVCYDGKYSFH